MRRMIAYCMCTEYILGLSMIIYDVVISGAGPVGLFLACELALAKCSVLIVEKAATPHSQLKRLPFGLRGLSAPTVEALDRRGLLQELAERPLDTRVSKETLILP